MTNRKSTKRALLGSVVALLLCFSMLIGTTFAWFTDTATSGSNVIQAGNLDIVLEYWNGNEWADAQGQVLEFLKASTSAGTEVLWEPGCTYMLPKIRVRNEGNLAAYVVLKLNGITGDEKLLEVISFKTKVENIPQSMLTGSQANVYQKFEGAEVDVIYGTPDGTVLFDWPLMGKGVVSPNSGNTDTSAEFTVFGHMKEEAGNEYQGLKIEGVSVSAIATQQVYEYDSFGREYDADATLPIVASNEAELTAALKQGGTVELVSDIEITKGIAPADGTILDLNGYTITDSSEGGRTLGIQKGAAVKVIGDGKIVKDTAVSSTYAMPFYVSNGSVVIDGGTYDMGAPTVDYNILVQNTGKLVINGGTFTNTAACPLIYAIYSSQVEINGGHFESIGATAPDLLDLEYHHTRISTITIKGGTFVNYNPLEDNEASRVIVADGYKVVSETQANGDVWYTVVAE